MFDVLTYSKASALSFAQENVCSPNNSILNSPLYKWLLNGKIAENPQVASSNNDQVIMPSGINKFLQSVTVKAQSPRIFTASLAVAGTTNVPLTNAVSATSDVPATATATVSSGIVTVTGVAAGTTAVRAYDINNNLIGIIIVTVA